MITIDLPIGTTVYYAGFGEEDEPWTLDHYYGVCVWLKRGFVAVKVPPKEVEPYKDGYKIKESA